MLIKTISERVNRYGNFVSRTFMMLRSLMKGIQMRMTSWDEHAQILASNWLDTVRAMVEEVVGGASTQSAATS